MQDARSVREGGRPREASQRSAARLNHSTTVRAWPSSGWLVPQRIDKSVRALHVVELGRRADLVCGELRELGGREIAPPRVAQDDVDPAVVRRPQPDPDA